MNGDVLLGMAIMGPYKSEREAEKISRKRTRLYQRQIELNQPLRLVDMPTVPADVRVYIIESVTAAIQQGIVTPGQDNVVFGKTFQ
jgi:hypothetical protein